MNFGVLYEPSSELYTESVKLQLDPWFEFMKRTQQYPEDDGFFLKGTNLIDWSLSSDGALFICDATAK